MLALSEVEDRHDGCFLVLGWVSLENLLDELVVLLSELERDAGIVIWGITVLQSQLSAFEEL
jgi:hypothetical protein